MSFINFSTEADFWRWAEQHDHIQPLENGHPIQRKRQKKRQKTGNDSKLEAIFEGFWLMCGYPDFWQRHYVGWAIEEYEIDFWHLSGVGVDVNGGIWQDKSGHNTGKGILRDYHKLFAAVEAGIQLIYLAPNDLTKKTGPATCDRIYKIIRSKT